MRPHALSHALVLLALLLAEPTAASPRPAMEVHPSVATALAADPAAATNVLVMLGVPAGVLGGVNSSDDASVRAMVAALRAHAAATQRPVLGLLARHNASARPLWISNAIATRATAPLLEELASLATTTGPAAPWKVQPDRMFKVELEDQDDPLPEVPAHAARAAGRRNAEWNVEWVNAPYVWGQGYHGKGFVHGNADTGIEFEHEALAEHYRGYGHFPPREMHEHNWWDATQDYDIPPGTTSRCRQGIETPCDDNGHGTHTVGTTVGGAPGGLHQIGVAPDAAWIGCRNMYAGYGSPSTYIGCLQFFIAPTDLRGNNPDTVRRAHTVGNSYGCPANEGCSVDTFVEALKVVRAAGVFMSVSAGNSGPRCSTVDNAPGLDANVCSVGASGRDSNTVASYSSRGPVTQDGSNRRKPDITAPGSSVRSAYLGNTYRSLSGTSMSAPAVAGVVLLLWSAYPELVRDIDRTERLLYDTAAPLYSSELCGDDARPDAHPNNVYGHGMIDAEAAFKQMQRGFV